MEWSKEVAGFADSSLPISKTEYPTKVGKLDKQILRYYLDNPRIYTAIRASGQPDQRSIEEFLQSQPHVQRLKREIVNHGGNQDEIIVRDKTFEVLEGNSRLAAFRLLNSLDYQQIRCVVLPEGISEDHVFVLLGQVHINGKTPWAKHEQARYLQRMQEQGRDLAELSSNIGLTPREGHKYVRTIELMACHGDRKNEHFSYWHAFLGNRKAQEVLKERPELEGLIAKEIKSGAFAKATEFRDTLTPIFSNRKAVSDFLSGKNDLHQARQYVESRGVTIPVVKKARGARDALSGIERAQLREITVPQLNTVQQDLKKIQARVGTLLKIITSIKDEEFSD